MKITKQFLFEILLILIIFATNIGVFHELAHAATALVYGYKVYAIFIGFPLSYTRLSGYNSVVLFSGGFTDSVIYVVIFGSWYKRKFNLSQSFAHGMDFLLLWAIFHFVYAIVETLFFR